MVIRQVSPLAKTIVVVVVVVVIIIIIIIIIIIVVVVVVAVIIIVTLIVTIIIIFPRVNKNLTIIINIVDLFIYLFPAIAPSFKNGFGPFYLFQDSEGRLKCDPEAAPRPSTFKWFDEYGAEIKSGYGYSIEQDGTLVISKVERSQHKGKFSCYAKNFLGNATAEGTATVYGKNASWR